MATTRTRAIVHSDPERMGGTPVCVGTCVPIDTPVGDFTGGDRIEVFLDQFPVVERGVAQAVIADPRDDYTQLLLRLIPNPFAPEPVGPGVSRDIPPAARAN